MSLRVRLTLVYLVLAAVALAGFALVVSVIASSRIYNSLDDSMVSRADAVTLDMAAFSRPLIRTDIDALRPALAEEASLGTVVQIHSVDGDTLYSSVPGASELPLGRSSAQSNEPSFSTHRVQGRRLRVLSEPIVGSGQPIGMLDVGQPLQETDEALNEIRFVSIVGGCIVLLLTGGSAYMLAGRAIKPVRQASRLAREIEQTADFSRRLPANSTSGEVGELTSTVNAMIARVEEMLVTQRAFLADSSHELRRPLTVLRTNIDVIKNPGLSADEREACLREMSAEAGAMSRLVSDLLLLSREVPQAIDSAPVDYSGLCEEVAARLRSQYPEHQLVTHLESGIEVMGDRERLGQMLWNIVENAAQYTPAGGQIEFRLAHVEGYVRTEVEDSGVGISEIDQSRAFDRFYRGELARSLRAEGVGLGLSIVKYVVDAHGGAVAISSRAGQGSLVVIDLPALA